MQPVDDAESLKATKLLMKIGECLFDLTRNGACLRPTGFGSRCCLEQEKNPTLLWAKLPVGAGISVKIVGFYGDHTSGGCATVRQLRIF